MVSSEESSLNNNMEYHSFFISRWQSFPLSFFLPILRAAEVEGNFIKGVTRKVQWHYFMFALPEIFACNKINTQQHVVFAVVVDNIFPFSSSLLSIEQYKLKLIASKARKIMSFLWWMVRIQYRLWSVNYHLYRQICLNNCKIWKQLHLF